MNSEKPTLKTGPMLNLYPDSLGGTLADIVRFLALPALRDAFQSLYILPSVFNTDLDRGFSVINYELNQLLATREDLRNLKTSGMELKFDFVLNHASVQSAQFQDILKNGDSSPYRDFFIDWNKFWDGHGHMTEEGCIQPDPDLIKDMFFRKPGLPILSVRFPDGREVPFWNTFYQEVRYESPSAHELMRLLDIQYDDAESLSLTIRTALAAGTKPAEINLVCFEASRKSLMDFLETHRTYLGQIDLNIKSPLVWEYYEATIATLANYGADIVRLDAFAYAPKEPGSRNFLNDPGTWDFLDRIRLIADRYGLTLLPEIHSRYEEKIHETIAGKGYLTYDFFLPGLIIDAFERQTTEALCRWIGDIRKKNISTVNMLGCHDGIPVLDLKGLLTDAQIQNLIDVIVSRGGYVKDLHGQKNVYYQVNATYYSALGEDESKLLLARAIQIFMPGKPQIWYLDLFAGKNDHAAVGKAGSDGHKEINRTNLSWQDIVDGLTTEAVLKQLELLRFRNTFGAFGHDAVFTLHSTEPHILKIQWERDGYQAVLTADLKRIRYRITVYDRTGNVRAIGLHWIYETDTLLV